MAQLVGLFKINESSTRAFYTLGNAVLNRSTEVSINLHEFTNEALENLIAALESDIIESSDTTTEEIRSLISNTSLDVNSITVTDVTINAIAAGDNNIGNVDIVTMPALSAGTNNIGDVDVLTLPDVVISELPSLPAGTANIGDVDVITLPALPAGSNIIGKVDSAGLFNVRQWSQFYNLRGQRFIATTGYIQNPLNTTSTIALFRNPTGSGKWIFFDQAEFGATNNTRFSRLGGGTFSVTGGPNTNAIARTDGGTAASVALIYRGGNSSPAFTVSSAGALRKVATMLAFDSYQLLGMNGTSILRPGQDAYWIVDEAVGGGGGNFNTFIDFEWIEIDETVAGNMATALAAHAEF